MINEVEKFNDVIEGMIKEKRYFTDEEFIIHIHNHEIPIQLWKQLPDHAVQILEQAGYTKYDRKADSIVFVEK